MLDNNLKFQENATESRCTIQSYTSRSCSYDCNCYTDSNNKRRCSTCYGTKYDYIASSDLCDGQSLTQKSDDSNGSCPQTPKFVGYSATCWVHCEDNVFSYSSPGELIGWSIFMIVLGVCCCGCGGGAAFWRKRRY